VDDAELLVRRSRGYAPRPIKLPLECPGPILAVGGQLKGVFALGRGRQAFLSHHMGDLDQFDAYRAFERDILLYQQLFDIRPNIIAHDLHPEYASTGYAQRRAMEGIELFPVQHHHAHMASCMAEHGLDEMVIGVTFDGTGFGTDATIWGGEFLVGDYTQFVRAGHLRCVRLPGGDKAIREPWRIALSHLLDAGLNEPSVSGVSASQQRTIKQMIDRGFNSPVTSSAGRLFDAVAAIAGVRSHVSFEGQAAIQLEWLATDVADKGIYPFELQPESASGCQKMDLSPFSIDTRPLIRAIAEDSQKSTPIEVIARRFHSTIVEMIVAACDRIRSQTGLKAVVLSGGVFLNALLLREVCAQLAAAGFRAYRHRLVPPGDGGLSLGQLAIAARTVLDKSSAMKFDSQAAQTELTA
jgi:hydrogenase maturation protein HypF